MSLNYICPISSQGTGLPGNRAWNKNNNNLRSNSKKNNNNNYRIKIIASNRMERKMNMRMIMKNMTPVMTMKIKIMEIMNF